MAVNNSLAKKPTNTGLVEYESGNEKVKLSPAMIKQYLVSGGGNVTDSEVMMFLSLCKFQHLNPFLREAYLIKFGNSPATMVVGKDVFTKRARRNPDYVGKKAGIIVQLADGNIIDREGTFYIKGVEKLLGGWCKVFIRGYEQPEYAAVSFEEYAGRKGDGSLNNQWATKPATMIRKVAIVHALREAFPEETAGMYSAEEIPTAAEIVLDDPAAATPIPVPAEADAPPMPMEPPATAGDVQAALFG